QPTTPEVQVYDLESELVAGNKPKSIILDNQSFTVTSWRELFGKAIIYLRDYSPTDFKHAINGDLKWLIKSESKECHKPLEVFHDVYFDLNRSSSNFIWILTKIVEEMGLGYDIVKYELR
ncbi:MAG: hypothetical protein ACRCXZ_09555, partial [Patescibacteria group bacterium]